MIQNIRIKFIRVLSVLLFIALCILYLLWLKAIHIKELKFQFTPTILILSSAVVISILLVSSFLLLKDKKNKGIFLSLNFISLILVIIFVYVLPYTGFAEYSYDKVVNELTLKNHQRAGSEVPANYRFPTDVDKSIDTKKLQGFYGNEYTEWIQGELTSDKDGDIIKVLVIYKRTSYNPVKNMSIIKLSDNFDTLKMTTAQGYERYAYPIEEILRNPSDK